MRRITISALVVALAIAASGCGDSPEEKIEKAIQEQYSPGIPPTDATTSAGAAGTESSAGGGGSNVGDNKARANNTKKRLRPRTMKELRRQIERSIPNHKGDVTVEELESLKVGDSQATVRRKLGAPLSVRPDPDFDYWVYDLKTGTIVSVRFDEKKRFAEVLPY